MKPSRLIGLAAIVAAACFPVYASVPYLSATTTNSGNISLTISNLVSGGTYYIEQAGHLASNDWNEVHYFEGSPGLTNWACTTADTGFFRVVRDPYHSAVGKVADFGIENFHDVSGTAHIVNNRTIELRDFNFDGFGVEVEVWLSNTGDFENDYISISDDLVGTPFSNSTLSLEIPNGTNLSNVNYISIWCVPFSASFGDGQFQ